MDYDESRLPTTVSVGGVSFEHQKFDNGGHMWVHQMTDEEISEWLGEDISSTDKRREFVKDEDGNSQLVTREAEEGEETYVDSDDLGFTVWANDETNRPMLVVQLEYWPDEGWQLSGNETIKPDEDFPRVGATEPLGGEYSMTFDTLDDAIPNIERMASKLLQRL